MFFSKRGMFSSLNTEIRCDIEVENVVYEHSDAVNSIVYFPEHHKLVSCSSDKTVRVWKYDTYFNPECEAIIRGHTDWVRELIVWDSKMGIFLSSSDDRSIKSFSIFPPYQQLKEFNFNKGYVISLLKLSSDFFMSSNLGNELHYIISYKKNELVRKLKKEKLHVDYTMIILSDFYNSSFYINTWDKNNTIKLIEYTTNDVKRTLAGHNYDRIYTMVLLEREEVHEEEEGESYETLVCSGLMGIIYFYKVYSSENLSVSFPKKYEVSDVPISTSFCVSSNLLLFGNPNGTLFAFVHKHDKQIIGKKQVHSKNISSVQYLSTNYQEQEENNRMVLSFATSSTDESIRVVNCIFTQHENKDEAMKEVKESFKAYIMRNFEDLFLQKEMTKSEINSLKRKLIRKYRAEYISKFGGFSSPSYLLFKTLIDRQMNDFLVCFEQKDGYLYFGSSVPSDKLLNGDQNKPIIDYNITNNDLFLIHGFGILFHKKKLLLRDNVFTPFYIGNFSFGKKSGEGKIFDLKSKMMLYDGCFEEDNKSGKGIEFTITKDKNQTKSFEGNYQNGKRHGKGEFYDVKLGKVMRGEWVKGILNEDSVVKYKCPLILYNDIKKHLTNTNILGYGGIGVIYRVRSSVFPSLKVDHEFVAVKIMKMNNTFNRDFMFWMTQRGIGLCSTFNSKHMLQVYGIVKGSREVGYVLQMCKYSMDKVINSSNMTMEIKEKIRILRETAIGMRDMHEKFAMHRDLKWSNVMISEDNLVKISDFDTLKEDERRWRLKSMAGTSNIGTSGFVSPEVFLGKQYSLKCDVYAFGLMIYSLLWEMNFPFATQYQCSCGNLVESIYSSNQLDYHVAFCHLRPLLTKSDIELFPPFLIDLMVQCWDRDPQKRPSFSDIVHIFSDQTKKKKCYSILILRFPKHEELEEIDGMLLVRPHVKNIVEWIEKKFVGSKVLHLTNPLNGESIKSDEDVLNLIQSSGKPILEVELDEVLGDEISKDRDFLKRVSYGDLKKVKREMRKMKKQHEKEVKEISEKYERRIEETNKKNDMMKEGLERKLLELRRVIREHDLTIPSQTPKNNQDVEEEECEGEDSLD